MTRPLLAMARALCRLATRIEDDGHTYTVVCAECVEAEVRERTDRAFHAGAHAVLRAQGYTGPHRATAPTVGEC